MLKYDAVVDIETNGLFDWQTGKKPTKIWCAVAYDLNTKEFHEFTPKNIGALVYFLKSCKRVIGHNFLNYDAHCISQILDYQIPWSDIEDTFVYSKMLWPKRPQGHGLAAWGEQFGIPKPEHEDWSKFSDEMLHRCREDVKINVKVWEKLSKEFEKEGFSRQSYEVERLCHILAYRQEKYGMWLDERKAMELYDEVRTRAAELDKEVSQAFPTLLKPIRKKGVADEFKPKYTKDGEISKVSTKFLTNRGLPDDTGWCTPVYPEPFNIASPKSRVEHLLRLGWTPLEFTDKGNPKITEESLEVGGLPNEVKLFQKYLIASNREKIIKNWLDKQDSKGFVHSPFNPIGTWTHRGSHTNFFGNPPSVQLDDDDHPIYGEEGQWGAECRDVWRVPHNDSSLIQVGADASGIQMRAFAHYINDPEYVQVILNSDIHTYNQELSGLSSRKKAKRFIYAFLLGAGNHKVGVIAEPEGDELEELKDAVMSSQHVKTREILDYGLEAINAPKNEHNYALAFKGMQIKNQFINSLPGLKKYRKEAKPGWWTALDGRRIKIPSKHLHLACALQSFESCVMKRAKIIASQTLHKKDVWFRYVNDVHDEFQIITLREHGDLVGQTVVDAIKYVGKLYGSFCPLDGEYKLGNSWKDCH